VVKAVCSSYAQNLRREHYELTVGVPLHDRVRAAFTELAVRL
jgi:hypothetical protein